MNLKNIISASQFNTQTLSQIFELTDRVKNNLYSNSFLTGKLMATLFYEPSTRTRLSFESAMQRLGGKVITTENASEFSSAAKGETLEDTIRVVNSYSDIIVLRHFSPGASEIASRYSKVPIINAGDGNGEHPTQALLDLYTIFSKFKDKKITVSMVGDLANGRTIHSLSMLLSLYKEVKLIFVSPKALEIPSSLRVHLKNKNVNFREVTALDEVLPASDVVYQTRIQKERFKSENEYLKYSGAFVIDKHSLSLMKKHAIVMHPLPRVKEISTEVDSDSRATYFEQVQNGLFVRMALLIYLFDKTR